MKRLTRKQGSTEEATGPLTLVAPPHEDIPTALRIMRAIEDVRYLPRLGDCPTKDAIQEKIMRSREPRVVEYEYEDEPEEDNSRKRSPEDTKRREHNAELVEQLASIRAKFRNYATGYLDAPFHLRITRPGCEFDDSIAPFPPELRLSSRCNETLQALLKKWFEGAAVSGYGDVQEQVTKVDEEVRAAREIPSSEFEVEPELLRRIEQIWCEHFVPGSDVRAEPYKIHLYGPGGHFQSHRDTPQRGLVGTFLLGLGDPSWGGGFVIDGQSMGAGPGEWCAFYPDVPHEVHRLYNGYRASIAFKIFRKPSATGEAAKTREVRAQVLEIVKKLEAPYAILLEHKYGLSTQQFSGFDAIMTECARSVPSVRTYHIPVVVTSYASWGSHHPNNSSKDWHMGCSTNVFPFARGYIDYLTGHRVPSDPYLRRFHTFCGCPWLEGVRDLPFFSLDLSLSTLPIRENERETCNLLGNEAQEWEEDSVYLSFALIVLLAPAPGTSNDDLDGSDGDSDGDS
ncbi:hypothetical protein ONZ51_g2453 [Trametes cubensis]|uniref:Prolyl 4-hydroxylase alpha subunit Fe(2+) 2OG dioxygenase domain-containing protein n=1 Tax=Trametes cubensis TaxID=1111947 RepID=A0AAD7XC27_9APHY|nr:hypothetical protein ONZ51_g2453 [Trametes cubensis]